MKFPLKILIVENEKKALEDFKKLLMSEKYKGLFKSIATEYKYRNAVERLKIEPFDVSILDVYLNDGKDCYDLIEEINNAVGIKQFGLLTLTTIQDKLPKYAYDVERPLFFEKPYIGENIDIFVKQLKKRIEEPTLIRSSHTLYDIPMVGGYLESVFEEQICFIKGEGKQTRYTCYLKVSGKYGYQQIISTEEFAEVKARLLDTSKPFVITHRSYLFNVMFYKGRKPGFLRGGGLIECKIEFDSKIIYKTRYLDELKKKIEQFQVLNT